MPTQMSETIARTAKNFLTSSEMKKFLAAARQSRHGVRNFCLMLTAYRHGLRVSELVDVRFNDLDTDVRRLKGSLSTHQPMEGDELRAIRAWLRERENYPNSSSNYLFVGERGPMTRQSINYLVEQTGKRAKLNFKINPHRLRHSTSYYLVQQRLRHQMDPGLPRTPQHHAHGALHAHGSTSV